MKDANHISKLKHIGSDVLVNEIVRELIYCNCDLSSTYLLKQENIFRFQCQPRKGDSIYLTRKDYVSQKLRNTSYFRCHIYPQNFQWFAA